MTIRRKVIKLSLSAADARFRLLSCLGAASGEPGIQEKGPGLWIPGTLATAGPGMTERTVRVPSAARAVLLDARRKVASIGADVLEH